MFKEMQPAHNHWSFETKNFSQMVILLLFSYKYYGLPVLKKKSIIVNKYTKQ